MYAVPWPANFARPASLFVTPLPTSILPVTTEFTESVPALQTTTTDAHAATDGVIAPPSSLLPHENRLCFTRDDS